MTRYGLKLKKRYDGTVVKTMGSLLKCRFTAEDGEQLIGPVAGVRFNKQEHRRFRKGDKVKVFVHRIEPLILKMDKKFIKPLLIFDVHGVLGDRAPFDPNLWKKTTASETKKREFITRPHCEEFLSFCFEHFEVAIWSSALMKNITLPMFSNDEQTKPLFVWSQRQITNLYPMMSFLKPYRPMHLKELSKVWAEYPSYNISNTLLLDNDIEKCARNPFGSCLLIPSFEFDESKSERDQTFCLGGPLSKHLLALAKYSLKSRSRSTKHGINEYVADRGGTDSYFPSSDELAVLVERIHDEEFRLSSSHVDITKEECHEMPQSKVDNKSKNKRKRHKRYDEDDDDEKHNKLSTNGMERDNSKEHRKTERKDSTIIKYYDLQGIK